jgi:zinc D-Ala-D-Ala carboxypeptidase
LWVVTIASVLAAGIMALLSLEAERARERGSAPPPSAQPPSVAPPSQRPLPPSPIPASPVPDPEADAREAAKRKAAAEARARASAATQAATGDIKSVACPGKTDEIATVDGDGKLLGHWPYKEPAASALASVPPAIATPSCAKVHRDALVAMKAMIAAAEATDPVIAQSIVALSCFRSIRYQKEVFCRKVGDGFAVRARASAPPGFSEHATGYAIDFGDRTRPDCNLSACFASTPVGQWLMANAPQYGFALSFPAGNAQGVMHEPWHWRFEGAPEARMVFAKANGG